MNRGIMVTRNDPSAHELVFSAQGICANEKDDPVRKILEQYFEPLAKAYLCICEQQKREFFGLRDFYRYKNYFVLHVYSCVTFVYFVLHVYSCVTFVLVLLKCYTTCANYLAVIPHGNNWSMQLKETLEDLNLKNSVHLKFLRNILLKTISK